jgi:ribose transport system ATP-binding protein
MIYQELSLAPHLSVGENILLGCEPVRGPLLDRGEMDRRAREALERVGRPDLDPGRRVGRLSPADQQLVEIARSVAVGCRVLVLDEPTSSLTGEDTTRLFDLVRRLRDEGHAVVYISHVLEEVREIADRFTVLRDGRTVGEGDRASFDVDRVIGWMVGRSISELYPRGERRPGELLLSVAGLAGRRRPDEVSLDLHRGEVVGIAGLVGAGRTELLRALFGLDPVVRGEVRVGVWAGPATPGRRWRQGVGMVSEDRQGEGLAPALDVTDNLTLSALRGLGPGPLVHPREQEQAARRWIEALDIRCRSPRQPVRDLSGGNQQKVALARRLHAEVDVLLLDEPTRGIDVGAKAEIYRLIDRLARGEGTTAHRAVLIVSSYLPELLGVCDRIAVMRRGRLGPARPVGDLDGHMIMREATGAETS